MRGLDISVRGVEDASDALQLLDTAAGYGDYEVLIGKWFKLHPQRPDGKVRIYIDSTPKNCQAACEQGLRKLGTGYIDLFYVHRFDGVTSVERTMEALVALKRRGWQNKDIGFSECLSDTLRRGHAVRLISAVQIEYNPWTLDTECDSGTHLLRTCQELGFLTGRYKSLDDFEEKDGRRQLPRFSAEIKLSKNLDLVKIFEGLAARKGCTPAQAVLAWIMAQEEDFVPIPGARNIQYLERDLGKNKHIRDAIVATGGVSGERAIDTTAAFADTPAL
ncbi:Aldo/keto reductase-like protein [Xylariaceae sp. FL0662B]|nr:Aldo/keto reductase-like protein [Xylariaceae sp. FL0662B]